MKMFLRGLVLANYNFDLYCLHTFSWLILKDFSVDYN